MASATKSKPRRKTIEAVVTVAKFTDGNHRFSVVRDSTSLAEYVPIGHSDYYALGYSTPLRDALARFIAHLEGLRSPDRVVIGLMVDESGSMHGNEAAVIQGVNDFVAGMGAVEKIDPKTAGTVLAVYATDGFENDSHEVSSAALNDLIARSERDGFTFIGLGAKIDAWAQGSSLGFSGGASGQMVSYTNTARGTSSAMANVTTDAKSYLTNPGEYVAHRAQMGSMRSVTESGAEVYSNINAPPSVSSGAPSVTVSNVSVYGNVDEALQRARKATEGTSDAS